MQLTNTAQTISAAPRTNISALPAKWVAEPTTEQVSDTFSSAEAAEVPASKVYGAVGAMTGALAIGRPAMVVASGVVASAIAGSCFGPLGTVVGAAVGLYAGFKLEQKTKMGRLAGGLAGGIIGSAVGKVAGWLGAKPSEAMQNECKNFSVASLPEKLLNTHYTSHSRLSPEIAAEGSKFAQPGDIIITNDDADFKLELVQKGVGLASRTSEMLGLVEKGNGCKANWTHIYTVDKENTVIDILLDGNGPTRFPLEHAFTDNTHAKILRPNFKSPEAKEEFLNWMGNQFGLVSYDLGFDMKTDNSYYCQEYVFKGLKSTGNDLDLKASQVGAGPWKKEFVSADTFDQNPQFKEVWSTGSNFWVNWLSHFT